MYSFKNGALFAAVASVACSGTVIADRHSPTVSDADVDRNGIVKALDLIQVATNMSKTCDEQEVECRSDVDKDGRTTITDLLHVIAFWGELSEHEPTPKRTKLMETRAPSRFEKLQSLIEWRKAGLLDSPEVKCAKRENPIDIRKYT